MLHVQLDEGEAILDVSNIWNVVVCRSFSAGPDHWNVSAGVGRSHHGQLETETATDPIISSQANGKV